MTSERTLTPSRQLLNKVPEVTLYFWIVKVLCTTVGESAADFLNVNLNFGLTGTSVVTGALLVVTLIFQFRADRYIPSRYWLNVALVSVFGTLVTDNLTDSVGVPLEASTLIFGVLLAVTFLLWYRNEKTLSIHSIVTTRRESFYWLAILFTFALGTATGDLMAEVLGLGYLVTGAIVGALIAITAVAWRFGLNPVLSFWVIYILTRPLGASIGDYLSQPSSQGGLGLGATVTSLVFVVGILGIVTYLSVTKADVIRSASAGTHTGTERGGLWQTAVVLALVIVLGGAGYSLRKSSLQQDTSDSVAAVIPGGSQPAPGSQPSPGGTQVTHVSPLGDLSSFSKITQDTLDLLNSGDQSGATARITDLETAWDNGEARLKPRDNASWTDIDGKIDKVLRELRSTSPNPNSEKAALTTLRTALG
ncbi:MAG TPA: hypothetical protein VK735_42900 [Pseudonocardia sp.]|jgi:uncharacterized membrane-anchored protein|uniref:COG4705 family protein n=1 Tax=Pseudonocardia sp. TaxID=60912 RepID=UPI002CE53287|nr:hypothetical protein [Pseudonocardia sp.]HTF54237.1 hypothetical protein [Pseudonocardia sp.]